MPGCTETLPNCFYTFVIYVVWKGRERLQMGHIVFLTSQQWNLQALTVDEIEKLNMLY